LTLLDEYTCLFKARMKLMSLVFPLMYSKLKNNENCVVALLLSRNKLLFLLLMIVAITQFIHTINNS
jgi:hypothetical protein